MRMAAFRQRNRRTRDRLRGGARPAGDGVLALHAAGKLHRDLKPSNVLVDADGRVVLLDFGLVVGAVDATGAATAMRSSSARRRTCRRAGGRAGRSRQASDWYAVGVMLYEALTGRARSGATPRQCSSTSRARSRRRRASSCPACPSDLDALCRGLLRRRPGDAPGRDEILRPAAGGQRVARAGRRANARRAAPFVGRERQLEALARRLRPDARRAERSSCSCTGARGWARARWSAASSTSSDGATSGVVVLAGRCYERESVPYKALDSLVDALCRLPEAPPDARGRGAPAARRPAAVARCSRCCAGSRPSPRAAPASSRSPTRRSCAAARSRALRELLARLADRRPLVLFIDDLQWGDADSAALLLELLRPPDPPALLLIACYRSEDAARSRSWLP